MKFITLIAAHRLSIVSFLVGGVVLSFELTASRIVAPYIGTTIYTWTSVIGVILAALATGYAAGGYYADRRKNQNDIVALMALASLGIILVNYSKDFVLVAVAGTSWPLQWQSFVASLILFGLPTFILGAVSPYLARLSITSISSSGFALARISAAGTLGSLAGTFITGYFLFGYVGSRYILSWLAICLVLVSFLISHKFLLAIRLVLIAIASLTLLYSPHATIDGASVETDLDTSYSRVIVGDRSYLNRQIRVLQTDNTAWQSGVYLDGSKELVFDYTKAFAHFLKSQPPPKAILIIGGGSFSLPESVANQYPQTTVEVVEIDPQLTKVAKKYFNFQQPSNLKIINDDGRQYINQTDRKYDIIFVDAFTSLTPPFQLMTAEAVSGLRKILSSNGFVAVNVLSPAKGSHSGMAGAVAATYKSIFKGVLMYQVDGNNPKHLVQNLFLVASNQPLNQRRTSQHMEITGGKLLYAQSMPNLFAYPRVLTDNFAPVERLSTDAN